ncbi:MAG: response regulator RpfG family c-di-GMP phosphodiesterase [Bacteriovoracaceae bacterium]|jgi:response regulator RpfG family c-di-GMP phosphodiesterase
MGESSKKKIIVADDEEGIRDVFSMIIESNFDHEIIECQNAAEAIEAIKKNGKVDLIFCDYNMKTDTGLDLYHFLVSKNLNIPFALCSTYSPSDVKGFETFFEDHPENKYFQKPFKSTEIIQYIENCFSDLTGFDEAPSEYARVKPRRFMRVNSIKKPFDIYVRLAKKKYVKIVSSGAVEGFDVVEKYIDKGVEYIYIKRADYIEFEKTSLDGLYSKFEKVKENGTKEEVVELVLDSIDSVQDYVRNLGVNERTIENIDSVVAMTEETIRKNDKLADLLGLLNSKDGFIKDHSYLTCYIACLIADRMSWQSEGIWKNIILASLFQNITLESDKLAKIINLDSEEFKALDENDQTKVRMHPQDAAKMLEAASNYFPEDTRKMIQNHHEQPDGSGYPRGLDGTKVSLLEGLFIISTNFARDLLISGSLNNIMIMVQEYNERFNKSSYKRPYQGFLSAFAKVISQEK